MKKILYFIFALMVCVFNADAASRTENAVSRGKSTPQTVANTSRSSRTTTARNAVKTTVTSRSAKNVSVLTPRSTKQNLATRTPVSRAATIQTKNITPRAATTTQSVNETRTGAEYEQCKSAFFTCMDQFCQLKNDNFRRCSCNDRVFDFQDISETYQKASERLTEFSEDLDVVGMTREQATAMKTASEGEDALIEDKSASKQLLQAIMNSIKGEDASVGGKYKDLNSVNMSSDIYNAFGMDDSGQIIASYNGANLYKAVYPKCRNAVKEDCNNASLQRAVNAYLMAIEQDCNAVESALAAQQKTLKASTHQSSAMLDLARVENRRNHNSDDVATCLANVESAIKSEEVCGAGYHKCLDNGQFIDVTTGAPLTGVVDFYKLEELLTYKSETDIGNQKLSLIQNNQTFVQFFENKTKKFAKESLDKCSEDADYVWQQYLDRALIDIYYAQKSKEKEIKQSCFDLVAKCYDNQSTAIEKAMANLTGDSSLLLKPNAITLTNQMCSKYIESCDNMFFATTGKNIIQEYIATKGEDDTITACRSVAKQCFDNFGGNGYNGFYSLQSGLFKSGEALDWFSLYKKDSDGKNIKDDDDNDVIVSPCAQQIAEISGCKYKLETIFGGFDKIVKTYEDNSETLVGYSFNQNDRQPRNTGIATETYNNVLDKLNNHCSGLGGYFVEYKNAQKYGYKTNNLCRIDSTNPNSVFYIDAITNPTSSLVYWYHFNNEENMCPANYNSIVDTQSWGLCSCWENGGQRSQNGKIATCRPLLPAISGDESEESTCSEEVLCKASYGKDETVPYTCQQPYSNRSRYWCMQTVQSSDGKICPTMNIVAGEDGKTFYCADTQNKKINTVIDNVPEHK